jgi:CDP-paratose 2-epimerase
MDILITGGCGFIGSSIATRLAGLGHRVTCFDNLLRRGSEILLNRIREHGCAFVHGDIRNSEDFEKVKEGHTLLIECSAEPSVLVGTQGHEARGLINTNLFGSVNCFEYARTRRLSVIFLSTSRVYPYDTLNNLVYKELDSRFEYEGSKPGISAAGVAVDYPLAGYRSLYGATKLASEYLLQEYSKNFGIPSIVNRCGVVSGPWQLGKADQGVFAFWLAYHYFKKELSYIGFGGKGKQVRDLLHILDLIDLIVKQIESVGSHFGTVFNAGGGRFSNLSLQETTALCRRITGNPVTITSTPQNRPADVCWYLTDNGTTENEFNWKPGRAPEVILADIYSWLKSHEAECKRIFLG